MRTLALVAVVALAASGCTLRPRYGEFVVKSMKAGDAVQLELVLPPDNTPLSGIKLDCGEGRARFTAVTDERGRVKLPVDPKLIEDNPVIVVSPPPGLKSWKLRQVFDPEPPLAAPVAPQ